MHIAEYERWCESASLTDLRRAIEATSSELDARKFRDPAARLRDAVASIDQLTTGGQQEITV